MNIFDDDRRQLLKWVPPLVSAVALPAHALTSPIITVATTTTTTATTGSTATTEATAMPEPVCINNVLEQDSIPETSITWKDTLTVAQYNGPGTLLQVVIRVFINVRAEVEIENLDLQAQSYTATLDAKVVVTGPASLSVPINDKQIVDLDPIDGTLDFAGAAGASLKFNPGEQMSTTTVAPGPFIGTGSMVFLAAASGTVTVTGSSAVASKILTFGDARIEVEYICS